MVHLLRFKLQSIHNFTEYLLGAFVILWMQINYISLVQNWQNQFIGLVHARFAYERVTEYFYVIDVNAGSGMCKDPYA